MVKTHLGYNVLMFGFDSVSRMTFMRFLPKSYSYLIKELGGIVMKGRMRERNTIVFHARLMIARL